MRPLDKPPAHARREPKEGLLSATVLASEKPRPTPASQICLHHGAAFPKGRSFIPPYKKRWVLSPIAEQTAQISKVLAEYLLFYVWCNYEGPLGIFVTVFLTCRKSEELRLIIKHQPFLQCFRRSFSLHISISLAAFLDSMYSTC